MARLPRRMHRRHVVALTKQHPGLEEVTAEIDRRFVRLLDTEPLEFHLAYAADIEATFTPMFNVWLRHRDTSIRTDGPDRNSRISRRQDVASSGPPATSGPGETMHRPGCDP